MTFHTISSLVSLSGKTVRVMISLLRDIVKTIPEPKILTLKQYH